MSAAALQISNYRCDCCCCCCPAAVVSGSHCKFVEEMTLSGKQYSELDYPTERKKKKKTAAKARGADDWKNPLGSLTHNPCSGYANWAANLRGIQAR